MNYGAATFICMYSKELFFLFDFSSDLNPKVEVERYLTGLFVQIQNAHYYYTIIIRLSGCHLKTKTMTIFLLLIRINYDLRLAFFLSILGQRENWLNIISNSKQMYGHIPHKNMVRGR